MALPPSYAAIRAYLGAKAAGKAAIRNGSSLGIAQWMPAQSRDIGVVDHGCKLVRELD
ncbi:hypothetical protein KIP88_42550 [Bradyrhizobium sp. SRL28]|uniref:hypothetical protein n=1 Tax=Bradyrhizobium sp. SRL28 TaxID=2836178 RepID=UPI001BDF0518|nr:hypothetical protein [Bradyrhizobium sp. SRL28]MBT1517054.1 hypothetical protein [Bradyrhizobium sp. SRL28]